ncbi:hypothetical protein B296_00052886, partial [Ensete ventricosum]
KFRSVFRALSQKFKIIAIPDILANCNSYEHDFAKNVMVKNIARSCVPSRVSIDFSCTILEIQNIGHSRRISPWEVIQTWFHEKMQWS